MVLFYHFLLLVKVADKISGQHYQLEGPVTSISPQNGDLWAELVLALLGDFTWSCEH